MTDIRAQVVFQGGTALPEDRFVNVLHFTSASGFDTAVASLVAPLKEFYGTTDAVTPINGIGGYLSEFVQRPFEIRFYNMADPEPRVPIIAPMTLAPYAVSTNGDLPEEVAIVLSLRGAPPVTKSRRGRLYLGPLKANPRTDASTAIPTRVATSTMNAMCTAAAKLKTDAPGWSIWSPTTSTMVPIVGGHVDNAFDIQRRRGPKTTARVLWPLP